MNITTKEIIENLIKAGGVPETNDYFIPLVELAIASYNLALVDCMEIAAKFDSKLTVLEIASREIK